MMPSRTNLATGIPSSKVKYSRLSSTDDGYIDLQFKKSPPKIPYKAIALATVLFLIGAFLIIIGSLLLAGYISKGRFQFCRWVVRICISDKFPGGRPGCSRPDHWHPGVPARILPPSHRLLCIQRLPGLLL
ncbi:transmembrane protein 230 isoform X1 [Callorhinus ursinus]|uniref:Transmembrane protein 230 isoform X1 n=2 Tax=Otariidae TaxID=9702 RepID=A0A3Q7PEW6_CALUR|nr:transmembrane protein 230 isoform X1 [Callorhinus ursinus]XP_025732366.1 transmembrane protein 230 isoform X1 [Callorhinus ursinus]XP_025732367.1 transmembrane protein 230 isoform X1 [Callorhinus ursinus]XP_025732368.1 transmembrane protein 230 isoform X1 [Callorhinus ursinus]XP_025732370.1 transmembrane protein 230 isoform X1 [Callorhinus ursinus]XP_027477522.1 transmembrane protein 230 isoform X1 [Zalophus californianus]XP_027477523.1 transmembrane protein 230 isoform X1 [Zalophus califo